MMANPHALPLGHRYWTLSELAARDAAEKLNGHVVSYYAGDGIGFGFAVNVPGVGNVVVDWAERQLSPHCPSRRL